MKTPTPKQKVHFSTEYLEIWTWASRSHEYMHALMGEPTKQVHHEYQRAGFERDLASRKRELMDVLDGDNQRSNKHDNQQRP